ncbi:MAG: hypothetical protein QF654_02325 [Alphaproteobacteria bacterium]|nr:hypothetical protein [Alphaproteobacteria bacterium]
MSQDATDIRKVYETILAELPADGINGLTQEEAACELSALMTSQWTGAETSPETIRRLVEKD